MIFRAYAEGVLDMGDRRVRCALGSAGLIAGASKREGDGATPIGQWPLRRLFYRADRGATPASHLPATAIGPDDGWCDEPRDTGYNRAVRLPYAASAEALWRDDHLYDFIVEIDHNTLPRIKGRGSAVFLHLARANFAPTAGCVSMTKAAMLRLLARLGPETKIVIE